MVLPNDYCLIRITPFKFYFTNNIRKIIWKEGMLKFITGIKANTNLFITNVGYTYITIGFLNFVLSISTP